MDSFIQTDSFFLSTLVKGKKRHLIDVFWWELFKDLDKELSCLLVNNTVFEPPVNPRRPVYIKPLPIASTTAAGKDKSA